MSEIGINWSKSQKVAFGAIQRGASEGMTAKAALIEYRAGGGKIRDAWWGSLFRETFAQVGTREKVKDIPYTYTVPASMYQEVDWDTREKYVMQMEVSGYSAELDKRITTWVTVETDKLITKNEYRSAAQEAIFGTIGSVDFIVDTVIDWSPLMRKD